ncbi:MAG: M23 family metallopeptidase [Spirochaetales bacterium]|nr:M23 family metallopeptidase [Spirochaetales bacterium]
MGKGIHQNCVNIARTALEWLDSNSSYSTKPTRITIDGVTPGTYMISILLMNSKELFIQEIISSDLRGQVVYRSWNLKKASVWKISSLEKFNLPVMYKDIKDESEDFLARIEVILAIQASRGAYFSEVLNESDKILNVLLPSDPIENKGSLLNRLNMYLSRYSAIVISSTVAAGVIILSIIYMFNIDRFQRTMESSIKEYSTQVDQKVDNFFDSTEDEIYTLVDNIENNQKSFEFDRHNSYLNVIRMSEELTMYLPARKEAYKLIADNIDIAATYSEIIYELSRLPTEEYQARIFLATNRKSVIPLSRWIPVFPFMIYPVKLNDEKNDGKGFRVTDGYMTARENPFGSGGATPHYAIDIINVSNISYVDHAGKIIRQGNPPGNVVSVYPGLVIGKGFDDRYGNYITLKHELSKELAAAYPEATGWASFYAHMESESPLKEGFYINANQKLGLIGNSGFSTGPHLHFEVRIYEESGIYHDETGRYNKINPFPSQES